MNKHEEHTNQHTKDQGRLVMVVENELSAASRERLKKLLHESWIRGDVTMISGLTRRSLMQARRECGLMVYDSLPAEEALDLMPWREVWLVAHGQVWQLAKPD